MPAAKEKISFQLVARFMALLFLLAATAALAQARGAAENRVWQKSAPITESLLSQPLQLLELHQVKAPLRWYDASDYTFAAQSRTAEDLVTWVDEGGDLRAGGNPGMRPEAYKFQSGTPGARSSVVTGRSQAPYLDFTDEAGNAIGAKFDGVQGSELIDRKLNPFFSAKAIDEATRQAAVAQYYGFRAVWELPTQDAVDAANRFMQSSNITGITVRLAQ